jgi:FkbM family methyltransferase
MHLQRTIRRAARPLRRLTNRLLRPLGFRLWRISEASLGDPDSSDALAQHLQDLLPTLGVDCVLDVGANAGQFYEFLRERVGFTGRVISFEPIPELARTLRERASSDPDWTVYDFALGSEADMRTLHIASRSGWSSLLEKHESPTTDFADSVHVEQQVKVPVRTLDDVLETLEPDLSNAGVYLKIDAQGLDLEVMKGGEQSLRTIRGLQTELELLPVYADAPSYLSVLEYLKDQSYEITGVFPVWRDATRRIGELDTVLRNMQGPELCNTQGPELCNTQGPELKR